MTQLHPLILNQRLDSRIWGGDYLATWMNLADAPQPLAEVWLVYEENTVIEGPYAGATLGEVVHTLGAALVGTHSWQRFGSEFPLLAKFIDAADHLSVQVHPDDQYAHRMEAASGFHGKTEAWYILHAQPEAVVLHGWQHSTSRTACAQALETDAILELVRHVPVLPHDTIFVPAGTVHAINAGIVLFEIQQKSDLTYRLYDYDRPRSLQVERALDVLSYAAAPSAKVLPEQLDGIRSRLVDCPFFVMERWQLTEPWRTTTNPETFDILTVIDGSLTLVCPSSTQTLSCGESVVLPALLGAYELQPHPSATVLRCGVC